MLSLPRGVLLPCGSRLLRQHSLSSWVSGSGLCRRHGIKLDSRVCEGFVHCTGEYVVYPRGFEESQRAIDFPNSTLADQIMTH